MPTEALYIPARIENFCWRIEQALIREGGFAMIHGDPGTGKSVALRVLAQRLARLPDITVGVVSHPQSSLVDFYRELGDIFAVPLKPHNRWGGFKTLREVWFSHMSSKYTTSSSKSLIYSRPTTAFRSIASTSITHKNIWISLNLVYQQTTRRSNPLCRLSPAPSTSWSAAFSISNPALNDHQDT